MNQGRPPPKNGQFLPKKRPKNSNFGTKTEFFGLGWSVQGPRTLFRRFSTQKNICCRVREPENGFSPPPPQMAIFCPKKGLKMPILDQKLYFLGLGVHFKDPHPILQMPDSKKHVLQGMGAGKWVIQPPPQKNGHFLPKKSLKMPILGQKQCFLGTGWPFQGPPSLFCRCSTQKKCVAALGTQKIGDSAPPPLQNGHFLSKNGLKMPFLCQNSVFWARVVSSTPSHPISQVPESKKHVLQG